MNAARTTVVALITFCSVAIPTTGRAHADEPLLCGLLTPCDPSTDDSTVEINTEQPIPVDVDVDLGDLDPGLDPTTDGVPVDLDTNVVGDADVNVDIGLLTGNGRIIDVDTDVNSAALGVGAVGDTVGLAHNSALEADARAGLDGVVVTTSGSVADNGAVTASRRLAGFSAAQAFCGIQVVIATSSSATCQPNQSTVSIGTSDGLSGLEESIDLCGVEVVVAGSATTDCGGRSATGSVALGESPTLGEVSTLDAATAAAMGPLCGALVAALGESLTTCPNTPQVVPTPGAAPSGPSGGVGTGNARPGFGGAIDGASDPTAPGGNPAQAPDDGNADAAAAGSGGSLPVTGVGIGLMLAIAGAALVKGLLVLRLSRTGTAI